MPRRTKAQIELARRRALAARKRHLAAVHNMSLETYEAIKAYQNGVCYLCRRANGSTKALSVDHDHEIAMTCPHLLAQSCERCWRGLLCGPCNKILGHARDEPAFFARGIDYLINPPAQMWRLQAA